MPRIREYQTNAEKQWAYRQRKERKELEKNLDCCAFYQMRDSLIAAGYVVKGESRGEVCRVLESLIRNAERSSGVGGGNAVTF